MICIDIIDDIWNGRYVGYVGYVGESVHHHVDIGKIEHIWHCLALLSGQEN